MPNSNFGDSIVTIDALVNNWTAYRNIHTYRSTIIETNDQLVTPRDAFCNSHGY